MGSKSIINPGVPIDLGAMSVHNITEKMVKNAPPIKDSGAFKFMERQLADPNVIVVGYNIGIDIEAYKNSAEILITNRVIDMYKVVYRYHTYLKDDPLASYRLNYLRYFIDINDKLLAEYKGLVDDAAVTGTAHSALFDALMTMMVCQHYMEFFSIDQMIMISAEPLLLKKLSFGKHKDKEFEEVAVTDYDYLKWLLDSEVKKCRDKGMSDSEMKNNALLGTILYFLDKYDPKK